MKKNSISKVPQNSCALVIARARNLLLKTPLAGKAELRRWIKAARPDGSWPDIDYASTALARWTPADHLLRLEKLSLAFRKQGQSLAGDPLLGRVILAALDHWVKTSPRCVNWWHNEIGVPRHMRVIIILLGDFLNGRRRAAAIKVLRQADAWHPWTIGANLVWTADLMLHHACLVRDPAMAAKMARKIAHEIETGGAEGIQPDFSFYQHGARLQQFHYGMAFISEGIRLAWLLRGTPWAFPAKKITLISRCILEGNQWMARGIHAVLGTMDRQASRPGSLRSADMRELLPLLMEADPGNAPALQKMLARQNDGKEPLTGYRHFPCSDFTGYHRPGFSFFVKTISTRTLGAESINGENLHGGLMNSGDAWLVRDGREYHDMQPVWDWNLLPGVTIAENMGERVRMPFAGGVGDGVSGLTATDFQFGNGRSHGLRLRKIWAAHGDVIVCLVAGIRKHGDATVLRTALDQSLLRGMVTAGTGMGRIRKIAHGEKRLRHVRWLHHGAFGYLMLQPSTVAVRAKNVRGSWHRINKGTPAARVVRPVFLPVLEHSAHETSWGYVLTCTSSPKKVEALSKKPAWKILRNDLHCQAVKFPDGTLMAAFYKSGTLKAGGIPSVTVDAPCLLMTGGNKIHAADPLQHGSVVKITIAGKGVARIKMNADGTTSSASI